MYKLALSTLIAVILESHTYAPRQYLRPADLEPKYLNYRNSRGWRVEMEWDGTQWVMPPRYAYSGYGGKTGGKSRGYPQIVHPRHQGKPNMLHALYPRAVGKSVHALQMAEDINAKLLSQKRPLYWGDKICVVGNGIGKSHGLATALAMRCPLVDGVKANPPIADAAFENRKRTLEEMGLAPLTDDAKSKIPLYPDELAKHSTKGMPCVNPTLTSGIAAYEVETNISHAKHIIHKED